MGSDTVHKIHHNSLHQTCQCMTRLWKATGDFRRNFKHTYLHKCIQAMQQRCLWTQPMWPMCAPCYDKITANSAGHSGHVQWCGDYTGDEKCIIISGVVPLISDTRCYAVLLKITYHRSPHIANLRINTACLVKVVVKKSALRHYQYSTLHRAPGLKHNYLPKIRENPMWNRRESCCKKTTPTSTAHSGHVLYAVTIRDAEGSGYLILGTWGYLPLPHVLRYSVLLSWFLK